MRNRTYRDVELIVQRWNQGSFRLGLVSADRQLQFMRLPTGENLVFLAVRLSDRRHVQLDTPGLVPDEPVTWTLEISDRWSR